MFPGDRVEDVTVRVDCLRRVGNDGLGIRTWLKLHRRRPGGSSEGRRVLDGEGEWVSVVDLQELQRKKDFFPLIFLVLCSYCSIDPELVEFLIRQISVSLVGYQWLKQCAS